MKKPVIKLDITESTRKAKWFRLGCSILEIFLLFAAVLVASGLMLLMVEDTPVLRAFSFSNWFLLFTALVGLVVIFAAWRTALLALSGLIKELDEIIRRQDKVHEGRKRGDVVVFDDDGTMLWRREFNEDDEKNN